jgi:hypothetical protein
MSKSPASHCFSDITFVHESRHGVHLAVRRRDETQPQSWLADLSCLPAWLLVGHGARRAVEMRCAGTPAMFQRRTLTDGLWLVRLGDARYLLGANPGTSAEWTHIPELASAVPVALPAEAAQFALGGPLALAVLRELCAFDPLELAQPEAYVPLLVAHHETVLCRDGDAFVLRAAAADGYSLGSALAAALTARGGDLIGYDDYQRLRTGAPE